MKRKKSKPYSGTIRLRGKRYCCSYWIRGRQYTRSFYTLNEAETFLIKETLRKRQGNFSPPNIRIGSLLDMVLSDMSINKRRNTHTEKRRIDNFLRPFFGRVRVRDFRIIDYQSYIEERRKDASDSTINRELALLRRSFHLALKDGLIDRQIHITMLKERPERKQPFTEAEYATFRKHLPDDVRRAVDFDYEVGWRMYSELLPLQWNQINFNEESVTLPPYTTKDQRPRKLFFTERMRELLQSQRQFIDSLQKKLRRIIPFVFTDVEGNPFFNVRHDSYKIKHNEPNAYFLRSWKRAQKGAKTTKTTHNLRVTACVERDNAGISIKDNQLMGGWTTNIMLDRYLTKTDEDLKAAARKINGYRAIKYQQQKSTKK